MKLVKKLLSRCFRGRDRNYAIIAFAPPVKGSRRRTLSRTSSTEARVSRGHFRTRFVASLLLFGVCALTLILIFYTGEYILQKSEPLIITEYSGVGEVESVGNGRLRPATEVYENRENSIWAESPPTTGEIKIDPESELSKFQLPAEVKHEHVDIDSTSEVAGCQLPRLDPFDPSIMEFLEIPPPPPIDCTFKYRRPILFSTDFGSNLVRLEDPAEYGLTNCCYAPFVRVNEETIKVSDHCHPISDKITAISPEDEFIIIYCRGGRGNSTKLRQIDMLNFVHEASPRLTLNPHKALYSKLKPKDQLNIALIGIDAVSHMNFMRTMPESYSFLRNVSAFGMRGYTKVGDNTFPNVVPILTGLSVKELEGGPNGDGDGVEGCWSDGGYFDQCPFIWKNFSQAGYVTSYAEDEQWMAAFNYEKYGFEEPPTNYYLRPFMQTLGDQMGHVSTGNAKLCYGPRLGFRVLLEYVAKLAVTMARPSVDRKYFSFTWTNSLSHDDLSTPHHGDEDLVSILKWLRNNVGGTNGEGEADTVLVLLSDHGIRWGDIRTTLQGRIEERMPFLYFVFPEWFKVKYADAIRNMETNSERLTTPFDLHETLLDLVDPERYISNEGLKNHRHANLGVALPRGISLFAHVPLSRTCLDAAIEGHWCICHSMETIPDPETNDRVKNATEAVLDSLNAMLFHYPQCSQLELTRILNAQELVHPVLENLDETGGTTEPPSDGDYDSDEEDDDDNDEAEAPSTESLTKLTVTFKVSPSNAIFEASVIEEAPGDWTVSGDVSRVNLYGNQSRCVDEYTLKKYCYCP